MKRGELIILWVGGLLSVVVLSGGAPRIPSSIDLPFVSSGTVAGYVVDLIARLASIWILCGLAWVTLYRRKKGD
jgi:hypothetical protein